jgi:hypothetical protein
MGALAELLIWVLPDALVQLFLKNSEDDNSEGNAVPPPARPDDDLA